MKLLLIDGYSLLYRAFFSAPPLTTRDGQPTGALFSFIKMILRLIDEHEPQMALVAIDHSSPTFRHDSFADYKAHRAAMPDDLRAQTSRVRAMLEGFGVPYYEHAGFEADDILGTLSCIAEQAGHQTLIVTGDTDALQLSDERTQVLLTRRGVSELDCYTPEAVKARYNFLPPLLPDYKGLCGDTSDNIPGVPGIGAKTASALVGTYGGMEDIYAHLDDIAAKTREKLEANRAVAFQSRDLARIVRDLPVEITLDAALLHLDEPESRARALQTAQEYEFKSLLTRFAPREAGQPEPIAEAAEPLVVTPQVLNSDAEAFAWLHERGLDGSKPVALVWEAEADADTRGELTLGSEDDAALYRGELSELRAWLEDAEAPKMAHDAKALENAFRAQGITLRGMTADTLLMGYLLDPNKQNHPLPALAEKHLSLSIAAPPPPEKIRKTTKKAATSLFEEPEVEPEPDAPTGPTLEQIYRATCAVVIVRLAPVLRQAMNEIGADALFDELELPLVEVLSNIESIGMALDIPALRTLGEKLDADARRLEGEIYELAGEKFTIGSPKQLQVVLYEKLGLAKGRANKTGFSTDVHTLERLAEEHAIVRKILDYRGTTKLKATYIDALLEGQQRDEQGMPRIHSSLNQTGTVSGRLSSSNPNLQNVPIRTEQGRLIRKAFIAPPGYVLMKADYSQIELRILAHITGDATLVEAFRTGEDVHTRTAADLFGVAIDAVDTEMRRKAKMTNYAIAYGVSGFGLARQLGEGTVAEAGEFIKRYYETLPGVKRYNDDTLKEARQQGYVSTLMGRRRPLPDIRSPRPPERQAAERTAINHPIQGTSADAMKLAMLAIYDQLRKGNYKTRLIMQVHDELVFEAHESEVEEVARLVEAAMRDVPTARMELRVPLEVEVGVGPNWNEAKQPAGAGQTVSDESEEDEALLANNALESL